MSNTTSWLGGLVMCKMCGRTMTVTKGGKKRDGSQTRYFGCTGKSHNRICKGPKVTVYADSLEDMVYELIYEKLETLKDCKRKISTNNTNQINLLKNRITEISNSEQHLVEMLLADKAGADMMKLLNERAAALALEKKTLTDKIETLENEECEVISALGLAKKWKSANYEERKAVSKALIHKICICEDGSVEVVWNI